MRSSEVGPTGAADRLPAGGEPHSNDWDYAWRVTDSHADAFERARRGLDESVYGAEALQTMPTDELHASASRLINNGAGPGELGPHDVFDFMRDPVLLMRDGSAEQAAKFEALAGEIARRVLDQQGEGA